MKALLSAGMSVQLQHDSEETSWEDTKLHGMIILKDASGKEVTRREGFQHNRKLRNGGSWDDEAVKELVAEVSKGLAPAA